MFIQATAIIITSTATIFSPNTEMFYFDKDYTYAAAEEYSRAHNEDVKSFEQIEEIKLKLIIEQIFIDTLWLEEYYRNGKARMEPITY